MVLFDLKTYVIDTVFPGNGNNCDVVIQNLSLNHKENKE